MRNNLIYFDSKHKFFEWGDHWKRSLIAFSILLVTNIVYVYINKKRFKYYIAYNKKKYTLFIGLLILLQLSFLASALGCVSQPEDKISAAVYGALVGLVVYTMTLGMVYISNSKIKLNNTLIDFIFGIAFCSLTSFVVFEITK